MERFFRRRGDVILDLYFQTCRRRGGAATLLRKRTIVEAKPETGQLPVRTLTFASPNDGASLGLRLEMADITKVLVKDRAGQAFDLKSYSMSAERAGEFDQAARARAARARALGLVEREHDERHHDPERELRARVPTG